ncbi:DUF732 domain-containing protein [Tomitella fengzijianii]|uniref:DUF732 domain-containing protein n=1 Tax=Tomitella fengzijianii TaxID=2597660 RepID=A0A516WZY3_9ACTN|nr:DUF732 domain-containing protein [Tomitella fengzijianii]QDQ96372.1 hypothetical protein FO059_02170 [Tomitella fengzijianii]
MKSTARRSRFGAVVAAAAVIALAGGLSACGDNESTVSSTPSAATSAPAPTGAAPTGGADASAKPVDPRPTAVPKTAPPETPEALPSDYPGPTDTALTQRDQVFLDALRSQKIGFADASDSAVSTGNYVCAAQGSDTPADQIHATVLASIALDAQARGVQVDAEKDTSAFIATAQGKLCK